MKTGATLISAVHAHTFTPASLNELRFATFDQPWDFKYAQDRYNVPCVLTDDGVAFPSDCGFILELWHNRNYDVIDTFSWNRGAQSWKFGGNYRRVYATDPQYQYGDTPFYNFSNVIDFANDRAYQETRAVDASTGKQRDTFVDVKVQQLHFFAWPALRQAFERAVGAGGRPGPPRRPAADRGNGTWARRDRSKAAQDLPCWGKVELSVFPRRSLA
jgi:hypothetical protein